MSAELVVDRPFRPGRRWVDALRNPKSVVALSILAVLILLAVLAPVLAHFNPLDQSGEATLAGPNATHWLGTDELGRDLWSRLLYGLRVDIELVVIAVPLAAIVGTGFGLLSFVNQMAETAAERLFDVILAFPALVMAVAIATVLGAGTTAIIVAVIVVSAPVFGRLTRTAILSLREREYVIAAETAGADRWRVLFRHILPNSMDVLVVQIALSAAQAVFLEGAMSYLGIGVRLPQPSLGGLLESSVPYLSTRPAYALGPIACFVLLVLGFNLLADGMTASVQG